MNILLLEDDKALNRAITKALETLGHKVLGLYDAESFLQHYNPSFDLYIFDINLPTMNGLELLKYLKQKNVKVKVIVISAYDNLDKIDEAYTLGCIDYIKKPFHLKELEYKIKLLDNSQDDFIRKIPLKEGKSLTKKEKLFLSLLFSHHNRVVSYEMIESHLYEGQYMSMESLRALVKRIRSKIEGDLIENVKEEGYRLQL